MPDSSPSQNKGLRIAVGLIASVVLVSVAVLGVLFFQGRADNRARKAQAHVDGPEEQPVMMAPPRMQRPPAALQHEYVAYFSPMDDKQADVAIDLIAKDAKKNKLSLVITCHGEDVINAGKDMVVALANQREETLQNALIGRGVDDHSIHSEWGDASIKSPSNMTPEHPTCEIETALPADPANP